MTPEAQCLRGFLCLAANSLYLQDMKKRTLLICLCAVLLLVIANAVAVGFLYSPLRASETDVPLEASDSAALSAEGSAISPDTGELSACDSVVSVEKPAVKEENPSVPEPEATVAVPEGPFEVRNCGTGKINSISQREDFSLEMKDEKGAVLWTYALPGKICGRIAQIDYYANRKIQYLFICGSSLYLLDRLGHIVKGFPVQLSSEVLLGPDAYDFSGAGRYNIMVLNRDGSIDMYNLKGEKPASWKSIRPAEAAIGLPELLEKGNRSWWVVRSSEKSLVYGFYGNFVKSFVGEPLVNELN